MSTQLPMPVQLNPRHGWMGWWPGWMAMIDPENARIPSFLAEEAARLPDGVRVLDAGAGTRPFAKFFSRQKYESCDMPGGFYKQQHDFECFLHEIPKADNTYDVVVNTQVLEHVPDPLAVMRELSRILKPGGKLFLTVPLTAPLHGEPWHFFHFTHHAIGRLAEESGFSITQCEKIGGAFWALGKRLPDVFRKWLKQYDPGRAKKRGQSIAHCVVMTLLLLIPWLIFYPVSAYIFRPLCYWLDRSDIEKSFTLGYTVVMEKKPTARPVTSS
jgi:SAM-dependent methyltransferase